LLGERVALQEVHAGRVVPYIELPSDKAPLRKSLLREYLLVWLLRERVARPVVVAGRVAPYVELPSFKALGELLGEGLYWYDCSVGESIGK
jgi:hypothetical protein